MKFIFIDEFKYNHKKDYRVYGLALVIIDSNFYPGFKKTFYKEIEKIGWDKNFEFKGKSLFSASDGDIRVSVEKRIDCMEKIVNLSTTKSGKIAKTPVYVSLELFDNKTSEYDCYKVCLEKIIKKLPKVNNAKKSLISVSYDENESLEKDFDNVIEFLLQKRGYVLFEKPYSVKSSLKVPGILFADYVCYFHQTFFTQSKFRKENAQEILSILEKENKTGEDEKKIQTVIYNYRKESKTKDLILSIKKVVYV